MNLNTTCTLACRKSTGHSFNQKRKESTYIALQHLKLGMQSSNSFTGTLARRDLFQIFLVERFVALSRASDKSTNGRPFPQVLAQVDITRTEPLPASSVVLASAVNASSETTLASLDRLICNIPYVYVCELSRVTQCST